MAGQSVAKQARPGHQLIVVDSSVWIDFLNGKRSRQVAALHHVFGVEEIALGDLMLCEILEGLSDERAATRVESLLSSFVIVTLGGRSIAIKAARNYRLLRRRAITIHKTIDLLIGAWCIEHGTPLLHSDRDFNPMVRHLGLLEWPA